MLSKFIFYLLVLLNGASLAMEEKSVYSTRMMGTPKESKNFTLTDLAAAEVAKIAAKIYDQEGYPAFKKFIQQFSNDDIRFRVFCALITKLGRINIFPGNKTEIENLFKSHDEKFYADQLLDILTTNNENFDREIDVLNEALLNDENARQRISSGEAQSKLIPTKKDFEPLDSDFSFPHNEIIKLSLFSSIKKYWQQNNQKTESYLEKLPQEVLEHIFCYYVKTGKNIYESVEIFKKCIDICSKIYGTAIKITEDHVILCSKWLKTNPIFIARMLKFQLSNEIKRQVKKDYLKNKCDKLGLTKEKRKNWLIKNEVNLKNKKSIETLFCDFCICRKQYTENRIENSIIGILTLLKAGFDPNFFKGADTPLKGIVRKACGFILERRARYIELLDILLNAGANPDSNSFWDYLYDEVWQSVLGYAIGKWDNEIVEILLKAGANPNNRYEFISNPLSDALVHGKEYTAELLESYGAKLPPKWQTWLYERTIEK